MRKGRRVFKSGLVRILANYTYEDHPLELSNRTFDRIRRGARVRIRGQGAYWEGRRFQDYWAFNEIEPGSVEVHGDDGAQYFAGRFGDGSVFVQIDGRDISVCVVGTESLPTGIDSSLVRAYRATDYKVDIDGVVLRIGQQSDGLLALHKSSRVSTSAFVTAWNPQSRRLEDGENRSRNALLEADIRSLGLAFVPGEGVGKDGWREASFLILGIERPQAVALAQTYGQNAIVFVGKDGIPELVLTPPPDDVMVFSVQANGRLLLPWFDLLLQEEGREPLAGEPRNGEEAAFRWLVDCSVDDVAALGIELVDGPSPMSDEQYALLKSGVAAANLVAESLAVPMRFQVE